MLTITRYAIPKILHIFSVNIGPSEGELSKTGKRKKQREIEDQSAAEPKSVMNIISYVLTTL